MIKKNTTSSKMSSKGSFQQFQFSEVSESRKKADVQMIQSLNPQHMQNHGERAGHRETDASQSESEFNLRKSLAWDSAFFTSPGVLDPEELETLSIRIVDNGGYTTGGGELRSVRSQPAGPERNNGIDECAVRKSLAWDGAFFTSSGVLNAEELSLLNGGFRPSEAHLLPGIEEVWSSIQSNSTRNTDSYSLASLEIDLLDNMRAFMQKSPKASSNRPTSTGKVSRENEMRRGNTSKILDASSRLRQVAPNKESKSFLKPPKISCRARTLSTAPNKRASLGVNHVKLENKGAQVASGRTKIVSKKTCIRGSCSIVPSSTPPVKSPSSVLHTAGKEFGGFCCAPNFTGKSPPDSLRRINSQVSSSVSTSRTPSKHSFGNKNDLMKSRDSVCLLSTPKSSSCTSPASSMDGWSSESSSIVLNPRSNGFAAILATTACTGISFGKDASQVTDSQRRRYEEPSLVHESQETSFMTAQPNKNSERTSLVRSNVSKSLTSSSLRMPLPKIGYFDAENFVDIAPNGGLKFSSGVQCTSSKNRSGTSDANGATDRTRYGMHRLAGATSMSVSKTGTKELVLVCLQEKKQPVKEHEVIKGHDRGNKVRRIDEDKENIGGFENQVDDLSRRVQGIAFRRELIT
ncbi:hypothetical protein POPTR_010G217000v4 [Populus trichocarpa]|uniref:Uncharacterized protein n=1 Tax=Populus trichocarpa TaxID=3694 RepID=A0ACC0SEV8_POPTR|nr:hypothetical protein POPTR_010G217000v4 [Populus trichocarpa]